MANPATFEDMRDQLVEKYRHQITVAQSGDKVRVFWRNDAGALSEKEFTGGNGCMSAVRSWIETLE